MTSESIKTGRELDALVAERVFRPALEHIDDGEGFCERCGVEMMEWRLMRFRQQGGSEPQEVPCVPEYSESIEAAMHVVEKMRERGVWTIVQTFLHTTQVRVEMGVPSSETQEWGITAPEAICKCAMRAITKFGLVGNVPDTHK